MSALHALDIDVKIWKMPVEIPNPIAFDQDRVHASYDKEYARRFWRTLVSIDDVFKVFRSRFVGKSSPVHFFWGSFDLAVTRFSGRLAPPRNDPDPILRKIMQEAYSHEVISAGWWTGRWRDERCRVLLLCRARTAGICQAESASRGGVLSSTAGRIPADA